MDAAPPVQRHGTAVLICGPAVLTARRLIALGIEHASRRDGIRPPPQIRALLEALNEAASAMSASDVRDEADEEPSITEDRIDIREAAEMLHLSDRQTRRIAAELGGRRSHRGPWTFTRAAVACAAKDRKEQS